MIFAYLDNLEAHRAEQSILLAEVEALPHSKPHSSQKTLGNWRRIIKNKFGAMSNRTTNPQVHRALLAMKGISVQQPKEKKEQ